MYDSISHCTPGYWFQYQVPPNSAPVSIIRMLSTPNWRSRAPAKSPLNPVPMMTTSTSSVSGSRVIPAWAGSSR